MARHAFSLLSFLLLSLAALFAAGVVAAAQTASGPDRTTDSIAHVTLGQSAVPLYGPWKFTVGDSPIDPKTGKPLWAEPDFDDSKWETVDLTPNEGDTDPNLGAVRLRTRLDDQGSPRLLGLRLVPHPG